MKTLGDRLRKARETKGLSIQDVHDSTKIRVTYLTAMEEGRFYELPGDVYVRGFLRSVAGTVGLEGDELISEYDSLRRGSDVEKAEVDDKEKTKTPGSQKSFKATPLIVITIVIMGLLFTVPFLRKSKDPFDAKTTGTPDTPTLQHNSFDIQDTLDENGGHYEEPSDLAEDPLEIHDAEEAEAIETVHELTAVITERCWVRVIADGDKIFERTMLPGETERWKAHQEIRLRLGNAGGVDLTYNDTHIGSPGKSGDVIEILFPDYRP